jgi:predicted dienelactone hydrolase
LCAAGFDVVGVDHHGTSYVAGKSVRGLLSPWDRPCDLSIVLDQVEVRGPAGVAGFSLGGYTAGALCGVRLSDRAFEAFDDGAGVLPQPPEFPDFAADVAALRASVGPEFWSSAARHVAADLRDRRVRAGFLLCPAIGPWLEDDATARGGDVPVAVRWTASDTEAPPAQNALQYARAIHDVDAATVGGPASGHYGFVLDEEDDAAAKADALRDSIAFFTRTLGSAGGAAR